MRLLIQRVSDSSITIDNKETKDIKEGLLVYIGIKKDDDNTNIKKAISKLLSLRFFEDENGKLKKNIQDINGHIMLVSNFSLYAKADKGTTLSFDEVKNWSEAVVIYEEFVNELKKCFANVVTGQFKSYMEIKANAIGPVNVILDF